MYLKLMRAVFCAAALLLAAQPALAARIYNYLPITIRVKGSHQGDVTIAPVRRSESVSWPTSHMVFVFVADGMRDTCDPLSFGLHAEMTGGHYLVVGHEGLTIYCRLCDSDHKVMQTTTGHAVQEIAKELRGRRGDHSC